MGVVYIFMGPTERTYKPGSKQDETPVLKSSTQGIEKSAMLRLCLPRFETRFYTVEFSLHDE